jgi:hypothetical protein
MRFREEKHPASESRRSEGIAFILTPGGFNQFRTGLSWIVAAAETPQVEELPGIRTEDFRLVCRRQLKTVKGSENDLGFDPRMVAGKEQTFRAHELMAKSYGQRKR